MNLSLALDVLERANYVKVVTFRKDGTPVPTPVWAIREGNEIQVWTNPAAGKVKRIRRNSQVQLAPCGPRGEDRGHLIEATARIMSEAETSALLEGLVQKYGWQARMTQLPNVIAGVLGLKQHPVGGIAITLT